MLWTVVTQIINYCIKISFDVQCPTLIISSINVWINIFFFLVSINIFHHWHITTKQVIVNSVFIFHLESSFERLVNLIFTQEAVYLSLRDGCKSRHVLWMLMYLVGKIRHGTILSSALQNISSFIVEYSRKLYEALQ